MPDPDEPDDEVRELEAAVEAEWRAENEAAIRSSYFVGVTPRATIRKRLLRERQEALEAEERRLRVEILRRDLAAPRTEPAEPEREERGPYDHAMLEEAVKLRHEGKSHDDMSELPGLSKRQARYIAHAVDAKKLRYTRYGLKGVTRTDANGDYIPKI